MKKEYITPAAEKVEFDYTDTVAACINNSSVNNNNTQTGMTYNNAEPGSGGWVCPCAESSWYIENGVCKQ